MSYAEKIVLSDAAEKYIDQLGDDIALGIVASRQLSPALAKFHWLAYYSGHASHDEDCHAAIGRLTWERDLWYFVANNRGKRPSDFYAKTIDALWAGASH